MNQVHLPEQCDPNVWTSISNHDKTTWWCGDSTLHPLQYFSWLRENNVFTGVCLFTDVGVGKSHASWDSHMVGTLLPLDIRPGDLSPWYWHLGVITGGMENLFTSGPTVLTSSSGHQNMHGRRCASYWNAVSLFTREVHLYFRDKSVTLTLQLFACKT